MIVIIIIKGGTKGNDNLGLALVCCKCKYTFNAVSAIGFFIVSDWLLTIFVC